MHEINGRKWIINFTFHHKKYRMLSYMEEAGREGRKYLAFCLLEIFKNRCKKERNMLK